MSKLFQNKSLLKSIQVFLVCLIVLGGIGGAKNVAAADKNILVYYTRPWVSHPPQIATSDISALGFNINIKERVAADELIDGTINLSDYSQVWIIDQCGGPFFTAGEISAIKTFRENCGGLLLSADDSAGPNGCQKRVNPITSEFNNSAEMFYGIQKTAGACISPSFTWAGYPAKHPLYSGLSKLSSTDSDTCFNIQNANIEVIARDGDLDDSCDGDSDDDIYGAVLDEAGKGRIVFDSSIRRFTSAGHSDDCCTLGFGGEYSQYQQNIAEWLEVCPAAPPPPSPPPPSPPPPTECKPGLVPCGRICDVSSTPYREDQPCTVCHLVLMMQLIMDFLFKIAAVVAAFFIAASGTMYIVSAGRPELLSLSKTTFKTTLLGFILVFIAWVLVNTILTMFGYIDPLGDGNWHIIC